MPNAHFTFRAGVHTVRTAFLFRHPAALFVHEVPGRPERRHREKRRPLPPMHHRLLPRHQPPISTHALLRALQEEQRRRHVGHFSILSPLGQSAWGVRRAALRRNAEGAGNASQPFLSSMPAASGRVRWSRKGTLRIARNDLRMNGRARIELSA